MSKQDQPLIVLTGATGYVGSRLLQELSREGLRVRCLARRPEEIAAASAPGVEVVKGDVLDPASLGQALTGADVAYYLIHSMGAGECFEQKDRDAAGNFAAAARDAGVRRIIYLGGLGDSSTPLSPHLRSRQEVGEILRASGIPVIEFRASVVIGAGSLSFEMIRALVERLPVMIAPRWVSLDAQPIGIRDLLAYLRAALDLPGQASTIFEIGGADLVSYRGLMREYARQRGLRRLILPVPFLTPWLSSLWLGLVTPLFVRVGRLLIESIRHSTVMRDQSALHEFGIRPIGCREAIAEALASRLSPNSPDDTWFIDSRSILVPVTAAEAFRPIQEIGGSRGWYYGDWLWRLRGGLDLLVGGVGLRRGRRHASWLAAGDRIDCWRVEQFIPDRFLRLASEMKLPGQAWLDFEVRETGSQCEIRQTALFDPKGVTGRLYWFAVYPFHQMVFQGMLRSIAAQAVTSGRDWRRGRDSNPR